MIPVNTYIRLLYEYVGDSCFFKREQSLLTLPNIAFFTTFSALFFVTPFGCCFLDMFVTPFGCCLSSLLHFQHIFVTPLPNFQNLVQNFDFGPDITVRSYPLRKTRQISTRCRLFKACAAWKFCKFNGKKSNSCLPLFQHFFSISAFFSSFIQTAFFSSSKLRFFEV